LLQSLTQAGVKRIVFDGDTVTGFNDEAKRRSLDAMAALMNQYGLGMAIIELARPQQGFNKLAYLTDYNVVRLHSLPAPLSAESPADLADRFALAVQDRNIRMIFLNAQATIDSSLGIRKDTMENILNTLQEEDGAIDRIQALGFELGVAEPFVADNVLPDPWRLPLKGGVVLGAVAFITLLCMAFVPSPRLAIVFFVLGLAGAAGLQVLSSSLLAQALALGVGIAAAVLAVIVTIRIADRQAAIEPATAGFALRQSVQLLVAATLISFIGIMYVVALLDHIAYLYVIQQYRGIILLHLIPIVLSVAYALFFHGQPDLKSALRSIIKLLNTHITVLWIGLAAVGALAGLYYMSRTGNAGQTTELERLFRSTLQDALGVRPRTKEFLFAHPLFILGAYLVARVKAQRRIGLLFMAIGSIGQLSVVDTFAHLHTPLFISAIRVGYGLLFGVLVGFALIIMWKFAERGWRRWAAQHIQS
jgi:hypothetical protein